MSVVALEAVSAEGRGTRGVDGHRWLQLGPGEEHRKHLGKVHAEKLVACVEVLLFSLLVLSRASLVRDICFPSSFPSRHGLLRDPAVPQPARRTGRTGAASPRGPQGPRRPIVSSRETSPCWCFGVSDPCRVSTFSSLFQVSPGSPHRAPGPRHTLSVPRQSSCARSNS